MSRRQNGSRQNGTLPATSGHWTGGIQSPRPGHNQNNRNPSPDGGRAPRAGNTCLRNRQNCSALPPRSSRRGNAPRPAARRCPGRAPGLSGTSGPPARRNGRKGRKRKKRGSRRNRNRDAPGSPSAGRYCNPAWRSGGEPRPQTRGTYARALLPRPCLHALHTRTELPPGRDQNRYSAIHRGVPASRSPRQNHKWSDPGRSW